MTRHPSQPTAPNGTESMRLGDDHLRLLGQFIAEHLPALDAGPLNQRPASGAGTRFYLRTDASGLVWLDIDVGGWRSIPLNGALMRPDGAGKAVEPGNGTNRYYGGRHEFRDATGDDILVVLDNGDVVAREGSAQQTKIGDSGGVAGLELGNGVGVYRDGPNRVYVTGDRVSAIDRARDKQVPFDALEVYAATIIRRAGIDVADVAQLNAALAARLVRYSEYLPQTSDPGTNFDPHDPQCTLTNVAAGTYIADFSAIVAGGSQAQAISLILAINGAGVLEDNDHPRPVVTSGNAYDPKSLASSRRITVPDNATVQLLHAGLAGSSTPYLIRNRTLKLTRIS